MTLSRASRLGPYEILEPIVSGGLGEEYIERDTRLDHSRGASPAHLAVSAAMAPLSQE